MEKSEDNMTSSMKKLFGNPATITFLSMNLFLGVGWGAADAYLTIYLTEELNADYELIGWEILYFIVSLKFFFKDSRWIAICQITI